MFVAPLRDLAQGKWEAIAQANQDVTTIESTYNLPTLNFCGRVKWYFPQGVPTLTIWSVWQDTQQGASPSGMHPAASLLESELFTEKGRLRLVRRARLVTYASLAVTLAGGFSGILAAMTLDRSANQFSYI